MKKRQLKIRIILFASLVGIMGILSVLYFAIGRGHNNFPVELPQVTEEETTAPETTIPVETTTELQNTEVTEEDTTKPIVQNDWANYNVIDMLSGDNWALTLISKDHPLDKNYMPTLAPVIAGSNVSADARVAAEFQKMYDAALGEGIDLTPQGAYCSYSRQQSNFNSKVEAFKLQGMSEEEARSNAEKRVGAVGCSESGAGLAVDIGSVSAGFADTKEYAWLVKNAHTFGFVLRYPQDKTDITGMIYQPWHWRYVGVESATEMKSRNLCLEEYLGLTPAFEVIPPASEVTE